MVTFSPATPELPVEDELAAQSYYRDTLGFEPAWHNPEGRIAAVARDECAIFFRAAAGPIAPVTLWLFTQDAHAAYEDLLARGANLDGRPALKPWGLTQFVCTDPWGHRLILFCD